jgi:branched-chain amino acid transport system substrate-binding protein
MQAGGDLVSIAKQYNEFKLKDKGISLAVGLMFDTDIKSIGADKLAGTLFTTAWFWNMDAESRAWADRFKERTGTRPTFAHAGNYSAATQYLEAVQRAGSDDSDKVVGQLEGKEINDFFLRHGKVRKEDHRVIHDAYLVKVKDPSKATEDLDLSEMVETIPADKAFKPLSESTCKLAAS